MNAPRRTLTTLACSAVLAAFLASCSGGGGQKSDKAQRGAAGAFLSFYVTQDGRVARHDKTNDTVSEGQAYGLLLAEVRHNTAAFQRIWAWTQLHLQQPDGLFASHTTSTGRVISKDPASDADLLTAWALLRYHGRSEARMHAAGRRVAAAILRLEVATGPGGEPVLTAGAWANRWPATLNPSYWSIRAMSGIAQLTGEQSWNKLAANAVTVTSQLTDDGRLLPPDWAQLTKAGQVHAAPAPGSSHQQALYGLQAQRLVIWFAASCHPAATTLAAHWWRILQAPDRSAALSLTPAGVVVAHGHSVLPLVAAAAAANAAGDGKASHTVLKQAIHNLHHRRTYYGTAWNALGQALLGTDLLGSCAKGQAPS